MKKILLCVSLFLYFKSGYTQSGLPDLSFGKNGIVTTDMGAQFKYTNSARQVLVTTDGSIYINLNGSFTGTSISKRFANGAIDSSFGINGYSKAIASLSEAFFAFQPDGKIIIAGVNNTGTGLSGIARLGADGLPDSTFGDNAFLATAFRPISVAIQLDGKIVLAGSSDAPGFLVARYNINGSPDNSFNGTGQAFTEFVYKVPPDRGATDSTEVKTGIASCIIIQKDGKIVIGGVAMTNVSGNEFAVARFNTNGSIDNSFDADGKQTTLVGEANNAVYSIALQGDSKIVLAGYTSLAGANQFAVTRYNSNGSLDNSFNGTGIQIVNLGSDMQTGNSVAVQKNEKIVVAGYTLNGSKNDFALVRFNTDGSLDNTFDTDGIIKTDIQNMSDDYAGCVAIQTDDKIIVAGYSYINSISAFVLARYNLDGSLDNTFDVDGKLVGDYNQGNTSFNATVIQADGKVLTAGTAWNGSNFDFAIARYNANGSLDNTFSDDGMQFTDFGLNDEGISLVVQPDGKIIVGGSSDITFAIARYNTDGSLDATFSDDGKLMIPMGYADWAKSVALQTDGKIILAGHSYKDANYDTAYFAVVRINSNGTLDNTFSNDGKAFTDFENSPSFANAVTIQSDGKIVVAGRSYINGHNNFSIARYNTDGSLDNTFSSDGKQNSVFGTEDYFGMSQAIQPDGKIVVAGFEESITQATTSFLVARYNSNGDLDNTFNGVGFRTTQAESKFNFGYCVAINSDGRIAIGGTNNNFKIALLKNNGTLDSTFGNNGILINRIGVGNSVIKGIAFYENKLYAAGNSQFPGNIGVVARYLLSAEGGPLPITLLDFKAVLRNEMVLLQWKTTHEQNLAGYSVLRSKDGVSFSAIGYAAANSNGSLTAEYSVPDNQPYKGFNYYKLKIIDKDATFSFSKIVSVNINNEIFTWKIFPNPVQNTLFVSINNKNEKATFQITDAAGRKIKELNVTLNGNSSFAIPIAELAKGVYTLQLNTASKNEIKQFIKE